MPDGLFELLNELKYLADQILATSDIITSERKGLRDDLYELEYADESCAYYFADEISEIVNHHCKNIRAQEKLLDQKALAIYNVITEYVKETNND